MIVSCVMCHVSCDVMCDGLMASCVMCHDGKVRVMVRAVTKLRRTAGEAGLLAGGGPGDPVPGSEELRTFGHLLSHKEDFLGNKQKLEAIRLLYDETEEFLQELMPSFDTFVEILGRLYINGFEICDSQMVTYGWGVYLGPRSGEDGIFSNI